MLLRFCLVPTAIFLLLAGCAAPAPSAKAVSAPVQTKPKIVRYHHPALHRSAPVAACSDGIPMANLLTGGQGE